MGDYFFGLTDPGRQRNKNEDRFIAAEFANGRFVLACVIDGVGGYAGGDVAANIAATVIEEQLQGIKTDVKTALIRTVETANTRIWKVKQTEPQHAQMACVLTCVVTDITNNKLYYAHVGDTRLYLLRDRSLIKLSKDQSVVGFLEDSGRLSEEEAMRHPRRNEITKALGFEETLDGIDVGESPFLPGDIILVCSDGLSDMISSAGIMTMLSQEDSLSTIAARLVHAANEAGGTDNITAVIVQNNTQPVAKVILKPAEKTRQEKLTPSAVSPRANKQARVIPSGRRRSLIILLSMLPVLLFMMILFNKKDAAKAGKLMRQAAIRPTRNEAFEAFIGQAHDSTKVFVFKPGQDRLEVAQSIPVFKDSFVIKGNGITITPAETFKGPAMIIANTCRQIVFDSLTFKNFDIAVLIEKNNVVLKNVRFINCRLPVAYHFRSLDSVISGRFVDSIFIPASNIKKF